MKIGRKTCAAVRSARPCIHGSDLSARVVFSVWMALAVVTHPAFFAFRTLPRTRRGAGVLRWKSRYPAERPAPRREVYRRLPRPTTSRLDTGHSAQRRSPRGLPTCASGRPRWFFGGPVLAMGSPEYRPQAAVSGLPAVSPEQVGLLIVVVAGSRWVGQNGGGALSPGWSCFARSSPACWSWDVWVTCPDDVDPGSEYGVNPVTSPARFSL